MRIVFNITDYPIHHYKYSFKLELKFYSYVLLSFSAGSDECTVFAYVFKKALESILGIYSTVVSNFALYYKKLRIYFAFTPY